MTFTASGQKQDYHKVEAISKILLPTNVWGLQCFLVVVNYLNKHLPILVEFGDSLGELTLKVSLFMGTRTHSS